MLPRARLGARTSSRLVACPAVVGRLRSPIAAAPSGAAAAAFRAEARRRRRSPALSSLLAPPMSGAAAVPVCHPLGVPPVERVSRAPPCRPRPVVPARSCRAWLSAVMYCPYRSVSVSLLFARVPPAAVRSRRGGAGCCRRPSLALALASRSRSSGCRGWCCCRRRCRRCKPTGSPGRVCCSRPRALSRTALATPPDEKLDALARSLRTQPSGTGGWPVAALCCWLGRTGCPPIILACSGTRSLCPSLCS